MNALRLGFALFTLAAASAAPAAATPPSGVEVKTLSQNVVDGIEYVVTRITVAPGGGTGWHFHPGEVFGFISRAP